MSQFQQRFNNCFDGFEGLIDLGGGVDNIKAVGLDHLVEFSEHPRLILQKTVVHVLAEMQIHSGFPIVKSRVLNHARDDIFDFDSEIKDDVGFQCDAINFANPVRISATNDRARHKRIDVAVRKNDETCAQSRNDLVFQTVNE